MPVEIKELTIRVHVNEQQGQQGASGNNGTNEKPGDIVKEAVEEVMRIIEQKKER
jgi:hypothetical protein